jgi:hypothetical protein
MFGCKRRRLNGRDSLGGTVVVMDRTAAVSPMSDDLVKKVRKVPSDECSLGFDAVNVAQQVGEMNATGIVRDNDTHVPSAVFFAVYPLPDKPRGVTVPLVSAVLPELRLA